MEKFYKLFLQWLLEDKFIKLVVKMKKSYYELPIESKILEDALNSKRLIILEDTTFKSPAEFASDTDMVVSTGFFFASALMECVSVGSKGIFCDYPNLRSLNYDLYTWGANKVIFEDLDEMICVLKEYKENPNIYSEIGDWSHYLNDIDPFRDNNGCLRIGNYTQWLLDGFDRGLSRDANITQANRLYQNSWGDDKIFKSNLF